MIALIALPIALLLVAALAQHWRYHRIRRDIVMDRQPVYHSAKALHVITALKLGPDQALLPGIKAFVDGLEATGALVVYAGKSVITGTQSSQLPAEEWLAAQSGGSLASGWSRQVRSRISRAPRRNVK